MPRCDRAAWPSRSASPRRIRTSCTVIATTSAQRRTGPRDLRGSRRGGRQELRGARGNSPAPTTGSARRARTPIGAPHSKPASDAGEQAIALDSRMRQKAISGSPPTWARSPSPSGCRRASSTAGGSRTSSKRAKHSTRRGSRAPPIARSAGGITACRACSAAASRRRKTLLRKALTYNPQSTATLYFLAEVLIERGKKDDARRTLQAVLDAPLDPDWTPEDKDFKAKAQERLRK